MSNQNFTTEHVKKFSSFLFKVSRLSKFPGKVATLPIVEIFSDKSSKNMLIVLQKNRKKFNKCNKSL